MQSQISFDQPLNQLEQSNLRSSGVISEVEVAVRSGDLLIAVDTLSGARRRLTIESNLTESSQRRLLKD